MKWYFIQRGSRMSKIINAWKKPSLSFPNICNSRQWNVSTVIIDNFYFPFWLKLWVNLHIHTGKYCEWLAQLKCDLFPPGFSVYKSWWNSSTTDEVSCQYSGIIWDQGWKKKHVGQNSQTGGVFYSQLTFHWFAEGFSIHCSQGGVWEVMS